MGRATGYGALVINTHSFKDVTFVEKYSGPGDWRGGAVTVGAGIQVREVYRLANAQNPPVVVVGGECPVRFPQARLSIRDNSNVGIENGWTGGWIYSRWWKRSYDKFLWNGYARSCHHFPGVRSRN